MKWFRLYHALADSTRIGKLSDRAFRAYILCQCRASKERRNGATGLTVGDASWLFRFDAADPVNECCATTPPLLVLDSDGQIVVPDWDERQCDSDSSYERVKRYRQRTRNGGAAVSPALATRVMERDRYECVFCGSPEERRLTVDHLIPVLRGGDNGPDNLACSCKSCNSSKKGRTPEEAGLGFYNAEAEVRYREAAKRIASKLKRYGNGLDKRKSRGEESSVLPNGNTAADAAKLTKDEVWDLGKAMLAKQGVGPKIAGSYIGHLIKSHGEAQVLGALRRAIGEQPADLREWLKGALRHKVAKANARAAVAQQIYGAAKKDEPAEPIDITGEARRVA